MTTRLHRRAYNFRAASGPNRAGRYSRFGIRIISLSGCLALVGATPHCGSDAGPAAVRIVTEPILVRSRQTPDILGRDGVLSTVFQGYPACLYRDTFRAQPKWANCDPRLWLVHSRFKCASSTVPDAADNQALIIFHERIGDIGTVIVGDACGLALDFLHESVEIIARIGDADHTNRRSIPKAGGI